jgi:hypothetical protein
MWQAERLFAGNPVYARPPSRTGTESTQQGAVGKGRGVMKLPILGMSVIVALLVGLAPLPSHGVIVLDSTWREEGGARGREADGFGAHMRLANQPQFRGLVSLSNDGGTEWGVGSGTWIGNDDSHGYILTSAHNFDGATIGDILFRTDSGKVLRGERVKIHPGYSVKGDHSGVDVAIVRLVAPVTDGGVAPLLYAGNAEKGRTLTFVGFGTRGIGSTGEDEERFNKGSGKAAAQGVVDEVVPFRGGSVRMDDPGNYLSVTLPREDGRVENSLGGARRPVSRLAGLIGTGDSGGSAWLQIGANWVIAGINTSGSGTAQYGDISWFARVSGFRTWIASVFPQAKFMDDTGAVVAERASTGPTANPPAVADSAADAPANTNKQQSCVSYVNQKYDGGQKASPMKGQTKAEAWCACLLDKKPDFKGGLGQFLRTNQGKQIDTKCNRYANWGAD